MKSIKSRHRPVAEALPYGNPVYLSWITQYVDDVPSIVFGGAARKADDLRYAQPVPYRVLRTSIDPADLKYRKRPRAEKG